MRQTYEVAWWRQVTCMCVQCATGHLGCCEKLGPTPSTFPPSPAQNRIPLIPTKAADAAIAISPDRLYDLTSIFGQS